MNIEKCGRCGIFHLGANNICQDCVVKDKYDLGIISSYMGSNGIKYEEMMGYFNGSEDTVMSDLRTSISEIMFKTGISEETFKRYLNTYGDQLKY